MDLTSGRTPTDVSLAGVAFDGIEMTFPDGTRAVDEVSFSVDFTVHLHRTMGVLADGEWLGGEFEVEHSVAGLALEHGTIVAPDGTVLAESFHTRLTG